MGAVNRHHTDGHPRAMARNAIVGGRGGWVGITERLGPRNGFGTLGQWRETPLWVAGGLGWNYGKARPPQRVWYSRAMAGKAIVGGRGGWVGITERLGPRNGLGTLGQWRETPLWVAGEAGLELRKG